MEKLLILENKKIKKLVNIHLIISFFVCLSASIMVFIFNTYFISFYLLEASIIVFRSGLIIGIFSFIYGLFFEKYLECA